MARVFVSHTAADKPFARRIAAALRGAGHEPWLDEDEILVGESIPAAVQRGLQGADFTVICLSKIAAARGWPEAERDAVLMQQLHDRKKRILPVRLEEVAPPYLIAQLAHVDVFPDDHAFEHGIARLIRSIEHHTARQGAPAAGSGPTRSFRLGSPDDGAMPVSQPAAQSPASVHPIPAYRDAAVMALSQRLQGARARRRRLQEAGIATQDLDREILDLRRQLREGGQLLAGDALGDGRFLLIKQVGRGGFAIVWEASDESNKEVVAIKVLHSHLAGDLLRRERFFRGARAMMALSPSGVVRVLEPEHEDGGFHYFVMELVAGGNLHDTVLDGHLEKAAMLPLLLQVCDAVAEAHAKGMVHRDIKPSNILLDVQGNPKLTDFDLVGAADTTGGTRTGALGTLLYSAPECLDKPQDATSRADVYGLGMTAIFCLSGRELSRSILRSLAPTIAQLNCSSATKLVLARAVAWEPDDRFADAQEMGNALRAAMTGLEDRDPVDAADIARIIERSQQPRATPDANGRLPAVAEDKHERPPLSVGSSPVSAPAIARHMILFLAANPRRTARLALDEEARFIQTELERSYHRDHFELRMSWAAEPLDLFRGLRKFGPTVVHFTGHGSESGLYFQGPDGGAVLVSNAALTEVFERADRSVRLVVLNTSHSDALADALRAHVDCVIGVAGYLTDVAARCFAVGLYGGLAEGESIAHAYRMGCAAIDLQKLDGADRPVLRVRMGVDAEQLVLVNERPANTDARATLPRRSAD